MNSSTTPPPAVPRRRSRLTVFLAFLSFLAVVASVITGPSDEAAAGPKQPKNAVLEAEKMNLPAGAGTVVSDRAASGRSALLVWSAGTATGTFDVRGNASAVSVTARADVCEGGARMRVAVDGESVAPDVTVASTTWKTYDVPAALGNGRHQVAVSFTNDLLTADCDRNLFLDVLAPGTADTTTTTTTAPATTTTTTTTPAEVDPLAGEDLHVSWSPATSAADEIRATNPDDAARLDLIARTPTARWFGEWSGNITIAADGYVREAANAGALPVLVTYMIPGRDCGSYSSGGVGSADAYRTWVRDLAAGIGSRPAVVIVEPDAVALADCLSATAEAERYSLLADAVAVLAANPATTVYLDAGHAAWLGVDELASRLRLAGIDNARGVSLNVSNFGATQDQVIYATALADRLDTHAVIDTSRNGNGSDGTWCNPFGRAIGTFPTTDPDTPSVIDALLWVKVPGESDGTCDGGPPAGEFWPEYAIDLVRNAGY